MHSHLKGRMPDDAAGANYFASNYSRPFTSFIVKCDVI
ncbi:hypothetical protein M2368_003548 [Arthrobacter sp. JUb119]|nr:hypothetical protein [Arthrobacter sp. JUb119]TDU22606.1 hypothetical protein EDF61_109136 [Arthrobacter sp. JUb115]